MGSECISNVLSHTGRGKIVPPYPHPAKSIFQCPPRDKANCAARGYPASSNRAPAAGSWADEGLARHRYEREGPWGGGAGKTVWFEYPRENAAASPATATATNMAATARPSAPVVPNARRCWRPSSPRRRRRSPRPIGWRISATLSLPDCGRKAIALPLPACHGPALFSSEGRKRVQRVATSHPGPEARCLLLWMAHVKWAMTIRGRASVCYRGAHPSLRSKERQHF